MSTKRKLILDCDPGTDDSVCILMALTHPDLELLAITAESGNLTSDKTSANALSILEYMERTDIPVAKGMLHPLVHKYPSDPYSHGEDGLGNHFFPKPHTSLSKSHAAQMIIDEVKKYPGEVSIVCTAPLTNLALAIMLAPEIIPMIKQVYHLGGSYGFTNYAFTHATGDNCISEWNVFVDPEAAKIVYSAGLRLITIGLDIAYSSDMNIPEETQQKIRLLNNKQANYTMEILDYIEHAQSDLEDGAYIKGTIDTVAMCAFICPDIIKTKKISVVIDTVGELTRGATIWDRRIWNRKNRKLSTMDFCDIESAYEIDGKKYHQTYYNSLGGLSK
ncbi:MAG: nucleoside hydrolase [Ruthenibacterium sp.]